MKTCLAACLLAVSTAVSPAKQTDLTSADAASFKLHLGEVVTLRGRLEEGMQGPCLWGATPTNVVFYVIPETPTNSSYTYPKAWTRLMHQQVQLQGELKFRSSDRVKPGPMNQAAPDYYYMVLQKTKIQRIGPP